MAKLMLKKDLKNELGYEVSRKTKTVSKERRGQNIAAFNALDRSGLQYGVKERILYLDKTASGETLAIQYPGRESTKKIPMKLDFRPKLFSENGSKPEDIDFATIWNCFETIAVNNKQSLPYLAALMHDMSAMQNYTLVEEDLPYVDVDIRPDGSEVVTGHGTEHVAWYKLTLSEDVWATLEDHIGFITLDDGQQVSVEGFVKVIDLLSQNEDCKYYYMNVTLCDDTDEKQRKNKVKYLKKLPGRGSTSDSNLNVISHLQGEERLGDLIMGFSHGRGVSSFVKKNLAKVTDGIITYK